MDAAELANRDHDAGVVDAVLYPISIENQSDFNFFFHVIRAKLLWQREQRLVYIALNSILRKFST